MSDKEQDVSPYLRRSCRGYAEVLRMPLQRAGRCTKATERPGSAPNDPDPTGTADANNDA